MKLTIILWVLGGISLFLLQGNDDIPNLIKELQLTNISLDVNSPTAIFNDFKMVILRLLTFAPLGFILLGLMNILNKENSRDIYNKDNK